jgi:DNA-binding NarL/FixJ family response regulator
MYTHTYSNDLSEREFQIMELVAIGRFNKEIADELVGFPLIRSNQN